MCRLNSDSSDGSKEPSKQKDGIPDSLPASQADTDWREFRARLIASQNASSSAKSSTQEAEEEASPSLALNSFHSSLSCPAVSLAVPEPLMTACVQGAAREEDPGEDKSTLWAHSLNFPEKGCLLVAHPLMFTTQQMYFSQVHFQPCFGAVYPCQSLMEENFTAQIYPKVAL